MTVSATHPAAAGVEAGLAGGSVEQVVPEKVGNRRIDRLWRKLYTTFCNRRLQHNRHLWPHVKITRDAQGAIATYSAFGKSIPIIPQQEAFAAMRMPMHLILSGPSVLEIDYERLPMEAAMGVNGSISMASRHEIPFKFYCVIDQNFVRRRIDMMREVVARDLTLFVTPDVLRYLVQGIDPSTYKCRICVIELACERAFARKLQPEELLALACSNPDISVVDAQRSLGYSFDLARGVFDADTVAYAALQVLVAGGCTELFIHGLDLNFNGGRRFYNEGPRPQTSRLVRHFEGMIAPSFAQAAELLRQRGVRVFNLSLNSALPGAIIPKLDWRVLTAQGPVEQTVPIDESMEYGPLCEPGDDQWAPAAASAAAPAAFFGRASQTSAVSSRNMMAEA